MAKVLIVDDDPNYLVMIKSILKVKGYSVFTTNEAHEGLILMLKKSPDLAIIGYIPPNLNGIRLIKDIRSVPEFKITPIIMLTNSGDPALVSKAIQLGVNDFLIKPFTVFVLLKRVEKGVQLAAEIEKKLRPGME
jgi:DNA-binding response OmpR family regulator